MATKKKSSETKSAQRTRSPRSFGKLFNRYHVILFTLVVGGSLSVAVAMIYMITTNISVPEDYSPDVVTTTFDDATIERVRALRPLGEAPEPPEQPTGRANPFP